MQQLASDIENAVKEYLDQVRSGIYVIDVIIYSLIKCVKLYIKCLNEQVVIFRVSTLYAIINTIPYHTDNQGQERV